MERINKDLNESKYAYLCVNLELDRKFKIRLREYERGMHKNRRIFKIKFRLQPSKGLYEGFVEVNLRDFSNIIKIFSYMEIKLC